MPLVQVLSTVPGTDWVPGTVVQATAEQATEWLDGIHLRLVRNAPTETADVRPNATPRAEGQSWQ